MAINITHLSSAQGADINVIKQWFEENASEYFDEIVIENDILVFKSGGETVLEYYPKTSGAALKFIYYTAGGDSVSSYGASSTAACYISKLTRTDCGLAVAVTYSGKEYSYCVYITRSQNGETAVIFLNSLAATTSPQSYFMTRSSTKTESYNISAATAQSEFTVMVNPVCSGTEDYFPNCYTTPFSQYAGVPCIFQIDGVKYVYNGYVALRE